MKMIFYSHTNKTHSHKKGFALSLVVKVRVFGTQTWPIGSFLYLNKHLLSASVHPEKIDLLPASLFDCWGGRRRRSKMSEKGKKGSWNEVQVALDATSNSLFDEREFRAV